MYMYVVGFYAAFSALTTDSVAQIYRIKKITVRFMQ